ncbi:MAG: hypothetical protein LBB83_07680 [Treponema sp.]|nr:hypothetical protein [Treponema sp.]
MITDTAGAEYYCGLGITHIWDLGVETSLDAVDNAISPLSFWAAGKIYALQSQSAPCVMMDTDFIVWKPVTQRFENAEIAVIHREGISAEIYPPQSFFTMRETYTFPSEWDWSVLPCNTAFLYISTGNFKDYYAAMSIEFMKNLVQSRNITAEMVFAEQRLLAMCAGAKGLKIESLLDLNNLQEQDAFTHVWGLKSELRSNQEKRRAFCISCIKRIALDFPGALETLANISILAPYFKGEHNFKE